MGITPSLSVLYCSDNCFIVYVYDIQIHLNTEFEVLYLQITVQSEIAIKYALLI